MLAWRHFQICFFMILQKKWLLSSITVQFLLKRNALRKKCSRWQFALWFMSVSLDRKHLLCLFDGLGLFSVTRTDRPKLCNLKGKQVYSAYNSVGWKIQGYSYVLCHGSFALRKYHKNMKARDKEEKIDFITHFLINFCHSNINIIALKRT